MTGVAASKANTMMAIMLENKMTGHRRPSSGPSEIQTHVKTYTAVKAFPMVGYVFCMMSARWQGINGYVL
jgi:hypothetical protein